VAVGGHLVDLDQRAEPVVVHRPVDQAEVGVERAWQVEPAGEDAPEGPQFPAAGAPLVGDHLERVAVGVGVEDVVDRRKRPRVGRRQAEQPPRPEPRLVRPPEPVPLGPVDRVVLARPVLQREAAGERLQVQRVRGGRRVRLAVLVAGLGAGDVLHPRQRQEVAVLGRVQDVAGAHRQLLPRPRAQLDRAEVVPVDADAAGPVLEQQGEPAGGPVRASSPSSTASATRGSWQRLLTQPAPGLRARHLAAAAVSGYQVR
jgi:hypothetical protein